LFVLTARSVLAYSSSTLSDIFIKRLSHAMPFTTISQAGPFVYIVLY
jgi:hypothetical protein